MNVLFIQNNAINESFIITDIISYLKSQGHQADLLIASEEKKILFKKITEISPELIILPAPIFDIKNYLKLAEDLKIFINKQILFWGSAATFYAEQLLLNQNIDFICRGEGEFAINELLENINDSNRIMKIKNIGGKNNNKIFINELRPLIKDLDALPLPDRNIYYKYNFINKLNSKRFITSRGCKNLCNACWNNALSNIYCNPDNFYRKKSPKRVIDEISAVKNISTVKDIHFSDDLFIHPDNIEWLKEFSAIYKKKIGIKYTCNLRPDYVNHEIAQLLADSGCRAAAISVETGNQELRNDILNKKVLDDHIINAVNHLRESGIKILTFNMMSIPRETINNIFETIEFNKKIKPDFVRINMFYPIKSSSIISFIKNSNIYSLDKIDTNIEAQLATPLKEISDKKRMKNLYYLFAFTIKFKLPSSLLKLLIRLPLMKFYKFIWIIMSNYTEKKFFNIELIKGFIYFLHTKGVSKRSENFTSVY